MLWRNALHFAVRGETAASIAPKKLSRGLCRVSVSGGEPREVTHDKLWVLGLRHRTSRLSLPFGALQASLAPYNLASYNSDRSVPKMGHLVSEEYLIKAAGRDVRGSSRVVFTNGCFDLLHPGHIRSLESGRSLGDVLVVGINSDNSVRELKGPGRPIVGERERGEILAALAAVDFVVIFDESTPRKLISVLLPDVLFKGTDWDAGEIVGREEVEAAGGKVISISLERGYSTTGILEKIRSAVPDGDVFNTSVASSCTARSSTRESTTSDLPAPDSLGRAPH
jgi:D-glycero-beta-D-manno-heptose 1-phosphate adenylyltransferase